MPQQIETLAHARWPLTASGQLLVRIPTVTPEVFEISRKNWVTLNAPHHFFLHPHGSLEIKASKARLMLARLRCDSTLLQFMASEQYIKDVTLADPSSVAVNKSKALFTTEQRSSCERRAA
jgi:hypothetical protein